MSIVISISEGGRTHPYHTHLNDINKIVMIGIEEKAKELPHYKSKSKMHYIYDVDTPYFGYDKILLQMLMLRTHNLKRMHRRLIAQKDSVQNVFTNGTISDEWIKSHRVTGGEEYRVAVTIAEFVSLIVKVNEERAFTKNQEFMSGDEFADDFILGEVAYPHTENKNRMPRFVCLLTQSLFHQMKL